MIITGIRANHNHYDSISSIFSYSQVLNILEEQKTTSLREVQTKVDLGGTKEELTIASFTFQKNLS